jgi:predicted glycosyltransferase
LDQDQDGTVARRNSTLNILMYSHDTYGLGHIRRTLAIASHLRGPNTNILILTGSPIAGRFAFPENVDFVRIPGMIKKTNEEYLPLSIKINPQHALDIRRNIITATAKTFQPHLFIVDKEPLGLKKEVLPTLQWLRRCHPGTHTILGLRDIMDEAAVVRRDWEKKGVYEILDKLYTEIWVYGLQEFYDPIAEYAIPAAISAKIRFTGYIPRKVPGKNAVRNVRRENGIRDDEKLVVVTTGGGGDGFALMDVFLMMLESLPRPLPFQTMLISGPFMPRQERRELFARARRLNLVSCRFYARMEEIQAAADLVVSMGGYNTICEILSQQTVALIIPRETPRKEQLIRAEMLHRQGLADYIPWAQFNPESLRQKVLGLLDNPTRYRDAISRFKLSGLETIEQRIDDFMDPKG